MSQGKVIDMKRDWRVGLNMDAAKGIPLPEAGNAFLMLTNGVWEGCIAHDEFGDRTFWAKTPPQLQDFDSPRAGQDLSDHHMLYVQHYLARVGVEWRVSFKVEALTAAIEAAARKNIRHPLREYLNGLEWDRVNRLERWCNECLGTELSDYTSAVGKWWMISAVARALEPGCQADHMLLLEGEQGARKSTALRILAGDWYLPELPDVRGKDAAHALHGRWIVECGELEAMRRSGMTSTAIKDFLTRPIDIYRPAYARNVVRRPRSVVFAGTTNDYESLSDPTGARRFWPIRCSVIDRKKLTEWRDQLWAESVARFNAGEQWHPTEALSGKVAEQQEDRFQEDSWTGIVLAGAARHALAPFTIADAMGWLGVPPEKWTKASDVRVGAILHRAGYRSSRARVGDRQVRQYARPTASLVMPDVDEQESDFPE
jgi:putative DNA primase/helicase